MKLWTIEYISYEGNFRTCHIETDDEANGDDAVAKAYKNEGNYSGDNIYKIISVEES